ncbi:hypothetical protein PAPYR_5729 [Paratrimastix pyriformis]|uniref:Uncharacterized protein n=1 Tax=Paratrimastix pyriformis TaxID=342808 RepID=A0ABQ8UH06_9EUKA|nr:hypothetical protein PAPYR_5729 [Paratrimastix pyriformis]
MPPGCQKKITLARYLSIQAVGFAVLALLPSLLTLTVLDRVLPGPYLIAADRLHLVPIAVLNSALLNFVASNQALTASALTVAPLNMSTVSSLPTSVEDLVPLLCSREPTLNLARQTHALLFPVEGATRNASALIGCTDAAMLTQTWIEPLGDPPTQWTSIPVERPFGLGAPYASSAPGQEPPLSMSFQPGRALAAALGSPAPPRVAAIRFEAGAGVTAHANISLWVWSTTYDSAGRLRAMALSGMRITNWATFFPYRCWLPAEDEPLIYILDANMSRVLGTDAWQPLIDLGPVLAALRDLPPGAGPEPLSVGDIEGYFWTVRGCTVAGWTGHTLIGLPLAAYHATIHRLFVWGGIACLAGVLVSLAVLVVTGVLVSRSFGKLGKRVQGALQALSRGSPELADRLLEAIGPSSPFREINDTLDVFRQAGIRQRLIWAVVESLPFPLLVVEPDPGAHPTGGAGRLEGWQVVLANRAFCTRFEYDPPDLPALLDFLPVDERGRLRFLVFEDVTGLLAEAQDRVITARTVLGKLQGPLLSRLAQSLAQGPVRVQMAELTAALGDLRARLAARPPPTGHVVSSAQLDPSAALAQLDDIAARASSLLDILAEGPADLSLAAQQQQQQQQAQRRDEADTTASSPGSSPALTPPSLAIALPQSVAGSSDPEMVGLSAPQPIPCALSSLPACPPAHTQLAIFIPPIAAAPVGACFQPTPASRLSVAGGSSEVALATQAATPESSGGREVAGALPLGPVGLSVDASPTLGPVSLGSSPPCPFPFPDLHRPAPKPPAHPGSLEVYRPSYAPPLFPTGRGRPGGSPARRRRCTVRLQWALTMVSIGCVLASVGPAATCILVEADLAFGGEIRKDWSNMASQIQHAVLIRTLNGSTSALDWAAEGLLEADFWSLDGPLGPGLLYTPLKPLLMELVAYDGAQVAALMRADHTAFTVCNGSRCWQRALQQPAASLPAGPATEVSLADGARNAFLVAADFGATAEAPRCTVSESTGCMAGAEGCPCRTLVCSRPAHVAGLPAGWQARVAAVMYLNTTLFFFPDTTLAPAQRVHAFTFLWRPETDLLDPLDQVWPETDMMLYLRGILQPRMPLGPAEILPLGHLKGAPDHGEHGLVAWEANWAGLQFVGGMAVPDRQTLNDQIGTSLGMIGAIILGASAAVVVIIGLVVHCFSQSLSALPRRARRLLRDRLSALAAQPPRAPSSGSRPLFAPSPSPASSSNPLPCGCSNALLLLPPAPAAGPGAGSVGLPVPETPFVEIQATYDMIAALRPEALLLQTLVTSAPFCAALLRVDPDAGAGGAGLRAAQVEHRSLSFAALYGPTPDLRRVVANLTVPEPGRVLAVFEDVTLLAAGRETADELVRILGESREGWPSPVRRAFDQLAMFQELMARLADKAELLEQQLWAIGLSLGPVLSAAHRASIGLDDLTIFSAPALGPHRPRPGGAPPPMADLHHCLGDVLLLLHGLLGPSVQFSQCFMAAQHCVEYEPATLRCALLSMAFKMLYVLPATGGTVSFMTANTSKPVDPPEPVEPETPFFVATLRATSHGGHSSRGSDPPDARRDAAGALASGVLMDDLGGWVDVAVGPWGACLSFYIPLLTRVERLSRAASLLRPWCPPQRRLRVFPSATAPPDHLSGGPEDDSAPMILPAAPEQTRVSLGTARTLDLGEVSAGSISFHDGTGSAQDGSSGR